MRGTDFAYAAPVSLKAPMRSVLTYRMLLPGKETALGKVHRNVVTFGLLRYQPTRLLCDVRY
eukprot:3278738-Rhodomonas_salina.2